MKNCLTVFNIDSKPEKSELLSSLEHQYKSKDKAKSIYENIIWSDIYAPDSFLYWLGQKEDFLKTTDGKEPHIDEFNDWLDYINKKSKINKTFKTNEIETTTQEFIDISDGLTAIFADVLEEKNLTFNDLFENQDVQVNNIKNESLKRVINGIEETINDLKGNDINDPYAKRLEKIISEINNNRYLFFNTYNNYLESTLKLRLSNDMFDISEQEVLNDSIEDNQEKLTRDSAYTKSSIEFDTKDGAPRSIKLMIASLKQVDREGYEVLNELGLPKIVDYNQTFNFIQQKLVDIPGDIELFTSELEKYSDNKPELKLLLKKLNFNKEKFHFSSDPIEAFKEYQLRTQFINQFDKIKYNYTLHIKDENDIIKVIDSNLDKSQNVKLSEWENNFKLKILNNPNIYNESNFQNIKKFDKLKLLDTLGIDSINPSQLPDSILSEIERYGMNSYSDFITIYDRKKTGDVRARLLKLAEIEIQMDNSIVELQHYNAEGKLVYDISLTSYLSKMSKELAYYAGNEDVLREKYPEIFNNVYSANSIWLKRILSGIPLKIGISTGFKNENKDVSSETSNLNRRDIIIQKIHSLLQEGQVNFVRAADRSVENIFYFEGLTGRNSLIVDGKLDAVNYLINHLFDEVQTILNYQNGIDVLNLNNSQSFNTRVFTLSNGKNILDVISLEELSKLSPDKMKENNVIIDFVKEKVDDIVNKETNYISKYEISEKDVSGLLNDYSNIETIIEQFSINAFINNIELTKVLTGDPQLFGSPSNFFKRMSMLNSTKEATRVDEESNDYISTLVNNFESKYGYTEGRKDSRIRTITINDIESSLKDFSKEEIDSLTEILGNTKGYNNINEADGFAYITYDEYRIMRLRYGDWTTIDENLYQRLSNENYIIDENDYHMIIPDKSQYLGKLYNPGLDNLNVVAGRKFSFLPLVPGLYRKGSVLDKLNIEMLSNGVGMAFMTSAAKFGHSVDENNKAHHNIYDDKGKFSINLRNAEFDILDYNYLGNQLKINKIPKTKQTEGTQKRKLNLSNFYENGEFKIEDESLKGLLSEYDIIQREKLKRSYDTLKTKLGLKNDLNTENPSDIEDFVNSLIEMGSLQGFTTNELQALEYLKDSPFIDILPNKQKVESFIMAKLKNNVVSQKRTGTSMAQASNVGFELEGDESRHDLKFYRLSKDKSRLLPMEVLAPLPKELIKYVSNNYNDGLGLNEESLNKFNDDIAKDNQIFEETGEMTSLTKLTTMVGFRIPTQGASSSDVAKIKRFYMPHIGSIIVVPKAIVAKTGSDFDIDKLNLYYGDFRVTGDPDYKIANKFLKDNLSRQQLTKYLKAEEISSDYNSKTLGELNKLFIDHILEADINDIKNVILKEYKRRYINLLQNKELTLEYISPEGEIETLSDRALMNRTLENEINITLSKDNWKQLLTPLDSTNLYDKTEDIKSPKSIVNLLRKLYGYKESRNMSDIFDSSTNVDKMIEFLSGKSGVGQVAVHNTNHILAQKAGLKMINPHDYFNIGTDGIIDLGNIVNEDNINISELLSELLTAYVDIAKDPYILDINAINQTANTILMMVRQGISLKKIFLFMNQPIIKDYLTIQSIKESVSTNEFSSKNKNVSAALSRYKINKALSSMIYYNEDMIDSGSKDISDRKGTIYNNFTIEELEKGITSNGNDKNVQLKSLDMFLELQRQSKHFQEMIRSTSPDTQVFKSFTSLENQINLRDKVKEYGMFENYDNMFNSFIGEFWNVKDNYKESVSPFFISQTPGYKKSLDSLKENITNIVSGTESKEKQIYKIENDFIYYLLNQQGIIKHETYFKSLFEGNKSVPKLLKHIQSLFRENDASNKFIELVLPLINDSGEGFDNVKPRVKKLTSIEKEAVYNDFKELKNFDEYFNDVLKLPNNASFYNRMVTYFIMQSGINNSPYNLVSFIPAKDYVDLVKPAIDIAKSGNINIDDFASFNSEQVGLYVLNNLPLFYKKNRILPFNVKYNKNHKKYSVTVDNQVLGLIELWQKGKGVRYLDYGPIKSRVIDNSVNEENYTLDEKNPLNCPSNKK